MLTTYFLKCIAEDIFKHQETSTIPYEFYIGLSSTKPNLDGTGVREPNSNTGYARVYVDNSNLIFNTANDDASVGNHSKIYFPESILPWTNLKYYVIFDDEKDGNLLMYGEFAIPLYVPIKTIVSIPVDALRISVKNEVTQ